MIPPLDVLQRAISTTRMLDGGMDYADVMALHSLVAEGMLWDNAAERLGLSRLDQATAAKASGHTITATQAFRAAAACFLFAQMAYDFDVPRKRALYARFTEAVASAGRSQARPFERIKVRFGAGEMYGWYIAPPGPVFGTVLVLGGQSGWGAAYLRQSDELNKRGLAALLVEGPGQGQTRMDGNVHLDVSVPGAYSAFIDAALERHPGSTGVGMWGNSMGGLYAASTAVADQRVQALCVNGAFARPRWMPFRTFQQQAFAMLGSTDRASIEQNFNRIALGRDDRIGCPVLVLHGGRDPLIELADQQPFLAAAQTKDTTLRVWDDGEHTIYNHSAERSAYVADWFANRLSHHSTNEGLA